MDIPFRPGQQPPRRSGADREQKNIGCHSLSHTKFSPKIRGVTHCKRRNNTRDRLFLSPPLISLDSHRPRASSCRIPWSSLTASFNSPQPVHPAPPNSLARCRRPRRRCGNLAIACREDEDDSAGPQDAHRHGCPVPAQGLQQE
jgi:hypothetical protein